MFTPGATPIICLLGCGQMSAFNSQRSHISIGWCICLFKEAAENICIVTYCRRRPPDWFYLSDSSFSEGVPEEFRLVSHSFFCDLLAAVGMGTRILNWRCGGLRMPSFHLRCSSPGCLSPTECFFKKTVLSKDFYSNSEWTQVLSPFCSFSISIS